jgi:hypothetical protein
MKKNLDIVNLIEKNPLTRLSKNYQNKLINKIKKKITEKEQQLFAGSFYCHLNHHSSNDFIIDLENVWKWIGFRRQDHGKIVLKKFFIENIDYKILPPLKDEKDLSLEKSDGKAKKNDNKEQILMTINTFKKFCLKAGTEKADEFHDYYIKLEELLYEIINEETNELKNQLQMQPKNKQMELDKKNIKLESEMYTPEQLLEKQKLDLEKKKSDLEKQKIEYNMLLSVINNKECEDIIKEKIACILNKIK